MTQPLKRALEDREPITGTWLSIGHPAVAEILASLEYDYIVIDTEHTPMGLETLEDVLRGIEAGGDVASIARVPWNDPVRIKRLLDTGVDGVLIPMVDTPEEAREAVEAVRYPPEGRRGIAAGRASRYGLEFEEYVARADEELATIVQIETETGVENAESIARVDGVDSLLVGPADLSAALDVFGEWDDDRFVDAVDAVLEAGEATGTAVGTLSIDADDVERWHEAGFDYQIVGVDFLELIDGARRLRDRYESLS